MHSILTVVVLPIALGFLFYTYGKNSSFMCEDRMEGEYQEGRRMTCNRIRAYNSGMGERLRSEVRWPRLSEQFFRVGKWSVCRG
jgi:hypothetical protein